VQRHARLLIQHGLTMTEAKKPRCNRCVQQLLATVSRASSDKEVVK
jgi:endonuclease III